MALRCNSLNSAVYENYCMTKSDRHQDLEQINLAAKFTIADGWLMAVERHESTHFEKRAANDLVRLLVIHNISLPPGKFGGPHIRDFFLGKLDPTIDPYFQDIYQLRVSAHCLIQRDGNIIQFVSFDDKAWHAGVSNYQGVDKCNDFSIGIELEGTDDIPYTKQQYQQLSRLTDALTMTYTDIGKNIVGHCDIAPIRKTDPGASFDWRRYQALLNK
jgi:AmpD protein